MSIKIWKSFKILVILSLCAIFDEHVAEAQCNGTLGPRACEVRLRTDAGWVCGRVRAAEDATLYASFRGVPYAKPPIGERRFKELEPPEPWDHLLDATEDGPACPQKDFIYNRIPLQLKGMSEDCIYLNVHIPLYALSNTDKDPQDNETRAGLPILVFVHGGAFIAGSGLTDLHGPEYLMMKPVIVITFNFRIGVFGFLSLDSAKIPGNQGLRDIITLLRWVHRNAAGFGGNPGEVTLVGHSTGAVCAHLVSLSQAAKGLIHKVVLMSGTAVTNSFDTSPVHAKSVALKFLRALGVNSTDPDSIHDRLVQEPLLNIMEAFTYASYKSEITLLGFGPVVESEFSEVTRLLDEEPLTLISKGRGKEYPLIIGFTTAEFNFFKWIVKTSNFVERVEADPTLLLGGRMRRLPLSRQMELGNMVKRKYLNNTPSLEKVLDIFSDAIFVYPAMKVAEWRAMAGAPVYLYQFSFESAHNVIKESLWATYRGVAHVEDLTFLFRVNSMLRGYVSYPPKNKDDQMKMWMTDTFANFVRCSNPTCTKEELAWPPLSKGIISYQDLAEPSVYQIRNLTTQQKEMVAFYDRIETVSGADAHLLGKTHNGTS